MSQGDAMKRAANNPSGEVVVSRFGRSQNIISLN
jgi:hypothetical protein